MSIVVQTHLLAISPFVLSCLLKMYIMLKKETMTKQFNNLNKRDILTSEKKN